MATLAQSDIEKLLRFVYDATTQERDVAVTPEIIQGLCMLVPSAEVVGYCELDWNRRCVPYWADGLGTGADSDDDDDIYWQLHRQHPVCDYFARTGDFRARRASDVIPTREWHARELYEYYRPFGYELAVRIPAQPGFTKTFMFRSSRRDFTTRDRLVVELLRPHLRAIDETYELRNRIRVEVPLTRREREILGWVEAGKTNAEIAQILWISPLTVRKHLENAYEKLGVRTRTAAVACLRGAGALRPTPRVSRRLAP